MIFHLPKCITVEKMNQELKVWYESQVYTSSHRFLRYKSSVSSETALREANGEIKETITASRIRPNNLTINPYLVIQTVGVGLLIMCVYIYIYIYILLIMYIYY